VPPAAEADLAFFTQAGQTSARRQMDLQNALRRAVERQDFALHYQPVISATAGELPRIIGAEALLRWNHPELGPISPAVFIPIAERIGLMDEIGPWILQTGCAQLRAWDEAGLPPLRLAVNLSARQFSDRRLVTVIADFVQRFSVPPRRLEVEMTETAAMQDRATTRRVFGELRELGVTIAIDDFGTGYSTMSHLRDVTFDTLKIDREFVRDVDSTPSSRAICKALIELGRGLDIEVLAEGVERTEEVATLQTYGCSVFQGFYFGRPMPSADFTQAMREQASLAA
jgi:EAL domain-containing protein (putative c-di-GMP-specific phosphodiesterase class I)